MNYSVLKSLLPLLLLLPFTINPQGSGDITSDDFYSLERQNWMDRITYQLNYEPDTTFDVTFYGINLDIPLDSHQINGMVTCNLVSNTDGLTSISLQLSNSFEITYMSGNVIQVNLENDTLSLTLDRPYNRGEPVSITMGYTGIPMVLNNTKGMRFESHGNGEPIIATLSTPFLAHLWFPCKDGPGDKADSADINITIPDTMINGNPLIAVSNGTLTGIDTSAGKRTFKWKERHPIVPYYIMAAVSNYSHFQQIINNRRRGTFPIDYYVFKEDSLQAVNGASDMPDVINFYIEKFGAYPFEDEKYGMSQLGFYGAIENQTNTIQNSLSPDWFMVSAHELSHMWFGDMITCLNWHHGWLNEGFATYCEALYTEHVSGFNAYKSYMNSLTYTGGGTVYLENISDPFGIFISIIYDKGAWVLHMLRGILGDSTFFNVMVQYAADTRFRYGHASTEDFREVCETVSGQDLGYFFDEWIYDQYYPRYTYNYQQDINTNELTLWINQVQEQFGWREVFEMPIKVKANFSDGSDTLISLWNDQVSMIYHIPLNREINTVQIDPDNWILKYITQITALTNEKQKNFIFSLGTNYPNPFNPSTIIEYQIADPGLVTLKIYDVLGNEIATLVNEVKMPGNYHVGFDGSKLSSGVYFYQLRSGGFVATRKSILMK